MPAWLNVPNALTVARIVLAPTFLWLYLEGDEDGALIAFAVAAATDALGQRSEQVMDSAGRVTRVVSAMETTDYTYTAGGRVASVRSSSGFHL